MNSKLFVARRESGLLQKDVAEKLHISKQTYYKKEKGIVEFKQKEMIKLARIFNCSLNDLFWDGETDDRIRGIQGG